MLGDTHLHTSYSFDAYLNKNQTGDPDTAYRWAKGLPVIHPYHRARVQIETPLDFLVVSDHAELIGVIRAINSDTAALEDLAAVWSRGNTRDEIFDAFQRKETYATTGTRLKVRVFGGWDFDDSALQAADFAETGYALGVPMGGALTAGHDGKAPQMIIRAEKDPSDANLDRVQVIKGWIDAGGAQHERVYNVTWAGDRALDADGKLTAVGNTVDLQTGAWDNSIGEPTLAVLWQDPDFDPAQRAFYYVRVLQIPTPRHSLLDSIALQSEIPAEGPATIQERAYTSPIWYAP